MRNGRARAISQSGICRVFESGLYWHSTERMPLRIVSVRFLPLFLCRGGTNLVVAFHPEVARSFCAPHPLFPTHVLFLSSDLSSGDSSKDHVSFLPNPRRQPLEFQPRSTRERTICYAKFSQNPTKLSIVPESIGQPVWTCWRKSGRGVGMRG